MSLDLGTNVAKFIDVARFINVAKSTVQLDLITGVPKIINGNRATVDNFRDGQRCAQFFMDIMKSYDIKSFKSNVGWPKVVICSV